MDYKNVLESSPIYDSIVICSADGMYGNEAQIPGWFQTFPLFGQRQEHGLFKTRTEAIAGLSYNNQQVSDRTDFAFHAYSLGVCFWGVPCQDLFVETGEPDVLFPSQLNTFWMGDLPNSSAIEFRVGSDVILTEKCLGLPPGYGPSGGGYALGVDQTFWAGPCGFQYTSQGVPFITNRFDFTINGRQKPIAIPRNATIEAKLKLSEWCRDALALMVNSPSVMYFQLSNSDSLYFPTRYGITVSLYGIREVQQRGQLSAT